MVLAMIEKIVIWMDAPVEKVFQFMVDYERARVAFVDQSGEYLRTKRGRLPADHQPAFYLPSTFPKEKQTKSS